MTRYKKVANQTKTEVVDSKLEAEIAEWGKLELNPQFLETLLNNIHEDTRTQLMIDILCQTSGVTKDQFFFRFKENLLANFIKIRLRETPKIEAERIKASISKPENKLLGPDGEAIG